MQIVSEAWCCVYMFVIWNWCELEISNSNNGVLLQAPFNSYSFELVGDNAATTFFQVAPGGSVTLRQSVDTDSSSSFQVCSLFCQKEIKCIFNSVHDYFSWYQIIEFILSKMFYVD